MTAFETDVLVLEGCNSRLKAELLQDLCSILNHYGVSGSAVENIQCTESFESVDRKTRIQLVKSCTVQTFKTRFASLLSTTRSSSLVIIYNGHGDDRGSLLFDDGAFEAGELPALLELAPSHLKVDFYLNCCFALQFFCELKGIKDTEKLISDLDSLNSLLLPGRRRPFRSLYDQLAIQQTSLNLIRQAQTELNEFYKEILNRQRTIPTGKHLNVSQSPLAYIAENDALFNFYPLSFGLLQAAGSIHYFFPPRPGFDLSLSPDLTGSSAPNRAKQLAPFLGVRSNESGDCDQPTFLVFQAEEGDSILFRWKDRAILIDGGS